MVFKIVKAISLEFQRSGWGPTTAVPHHAHHAEGLGGDTGTSPRAHEARAHRTANREHRPVRPHSGRIRALPGGPCGHAEAGLADLSSTPQERSGPGGVPVSGGPRSKALPPTGPSALLFALNQHTRGFCKDWLWPAVGNGMRSLFNFVETQRP